ncbi:hypothetical protein BCR33DRAFT_737451 [Rhizoclosmatium globosum]|uniref:Uncharacterized protein n=1 Tax=Rhizoclosmatium globosum TaxID=329046 RepID=A0A1Y2CDA3_9FUNG|nr:hypothetical protein BCR33DRAFT_737451 [Rhizoclosmatium globosum]|eukprot:ORY45041.1 hypothetical protein BCR33DRAFT_737451 [Rhizoclosmatium globosum]
MWSETLGVKFIIPRKSSGKKSSKHDHLITPTEDLIDRTQGFYTPELGELGSIPIDGRKCWCSLVVTQLGIRSRHSRFGPYALLFASTPKLASAWCLPGVCLASKLVSVILKMDLLLSKALLIQKLLHFKRFGSVGNSLGVRSERSRFGPYALLFASTPKLASAWCLPGVCLASKLVSVILKMDLLLSKALLIQKLLHFKRFGSVGNSLGVRSERSRFGPYVLLFASTPKLASAWCLPGVCLASKLVSVILKMDLLLSKALLIQKLLHFKRFGSVGNSLGIRSERSRFGPYALLFASTPKLASAWCLPGVCLASKLVSVILKMDLLLSKAFLIHKLLHFKRFG